MRMDGWFVRLADLRRRDDCAVDYSEVTSRGRRLHFGILTNENIYISFSTPFFLFHADYNFGGIQTRRIH